MRLGPIGGAYFDFWPRLIHELGVDSSFPDVPLGGVIYEGKVTADAF